MAPDASQPSRHTVGRLSLYRGLLDRLLGEGRSHVFSHELAALAGATASQVRRDLMAVGSVGSPVRGYDVRALADTIGRFLDAPEGQRAALVGVGHLGGAILAFFAGRRPHLSIVAAFDTDPQKTDRVILGCRCYQAAEMEKVIAAEKIDVAVLAVPAGAAQAAADSLVRAGVRGLLNFAPVRLRVPEGVFVEDMDMAVSLEKVAFFARHAGTADA